ncbi:MAG: hypothetical protein ACK4RV_10485 [Caulobacter sp.]
MIEAGVECGNALCGSDLSSEEMTARVYRAMLSAARSPQVGGEEVAVKALAQLAEWFDEYADHHAAKPDPEKAQRNRDRAAFARDAILSLINGGK